MKKETNIFEIEEPFSKEDFEILAIITSPKIDLDKLEKFGSVVIKITHGKKNINTSLIFKSNDGSLNLKKKISSEKKEE